LATVVADFFRGAITVAAVAAFFVLGATCVVDDSRTPQAVATEATQSMVGQSALRRMARL
jgi:hypothetical protein